jgi:pentatricopeptide repeat protein
MPADVHSTNPVVDEAKGLIVKDLQSAPHFDDTDNEASRERLVSTVTDAQRLFNEGDRSVALETLKRKKADGVIESLPDDNLTMEQMRESAVARKVSPMPDFTKEFQGVISHDDLKDIDDLAYNMAQSVKLASTAKQPYDTASMVVKSRIEDLPVDENEFFTLLGMPAEHLRTSRGYVRYLRVLSLKGTMRQALKVWSKMMSKGQLMTPGTFTEMISVCKLPIIQADAQGIVDFMMVNPPDPSKAVNYPVEWTLPVKGNDTLMPPTAERHHGAPEGFVSVAPYFISYGSPNRRTSFNPHVELAFYLFEQARRMGVAADNKMYTALVGVCAQHGHRERAFAVYEQMKRHANGGEIDPTYIPLKKNKELMAAPARAKTRGLETDTIMVTMLMKACWISHSFDEAEEILHHMWSMEGITPDAPMYNLMIRIAADTSHVEKAFKYFEQMQHFGSSPSIVTYSALIHACAQPGRPEFYPRAFEVFHECVAAGFRPNRHILRALLNASLKQCDLNNGLSVWRIISTEYPHLRDEGMFTMLMRLIAESMDNELLPGFGGSIMVRGSRTLYGPMPGSEDPALKNKHFLSREERVAIAEQLYSELLLAIEGKDISEGKAHNRRLRIDMQFICALIGVYSRAAAGIMRYDRREREEGREDPHLRLTETVITQMIERTWKRIAQVKDAHPDTFDLSPYLYGEVMEMYGAADHLEMAMVHYDYMTKLLNIKPNMKVYNVMLKWARRNRHQGAAFMVISKMREHGFAANHDDIRFFERMQKAAENPPRDTYFPSIDYSRDNTESKFQNVKRRGTNSRIKHQHPLDFDVNYKDF